MTLHSNMTVQEVAIAMPQSTRIFEKLKIDYCCGGKTPLIDACAKAGVELKEVEHLLEQAKATEEHPIDFNSATVRALIDHIVEKHHAYTKDEIARLEPLLAKVLSVHGQNHPELQKVSVLFKQLCDEMTPHMMKEEQILFPYIKQLDRAAAQTLPAPFAPFGTVNNPVRMMMIEHDAAGEILRELRFLSSGYSAPADACISFRTLYDALAEFERDMHQHIHLENNLLFPKAVGLEAALIS